MNSQSFKSSTVKSAGYDPAARELEIEFASGELYRYSDVPEAVFQGLQNADSKGRYFGASIRPKFKFRKLETSS
jgi:hypothetical protein